MRLGSVLVEYRKQAGLSQEALAEKLYVSRQTISNWETGKTYPDVQSLVLLATIYHTTVDVLIHDDVGEIQRRGMQQRTRWLMIGVLGCIVATYLAFLSQRWLSPVISALLIGAFTTVGIALIVIGSLTAKRLQLHTMRQIAAYLNNEPVQSHGKTSRTRVISQAILGAIIGLALGGGLLWWLATTFLGWSF